MSYWKRTIVILALFSSSMMIVRDTAYAISLTDPDRFPWFQQFQTIGDLMTVLLPNILLLAGVSLFIIILAMGFKIMQSGGSGDTESMAKGKRALTYAIGGFVLIFSAYFIIQLVEFLTGIKIFSPNLG